MSCISMLGCRLVGEESSNLNSKQLQLFWEKIEKTHPGNSAGAFFC